ncbi:MAG: hypothetical protein HY272_05160 [Gammaproteobacteria bacterium]|nr:hypothetical protein [Gammaproteobacteria bacterium]
MKKLVLFCLGLTLSVGASLANAGSCEVHYKRTACKGQEATAYRKCNGEKECNKDHDADSVAACQDLAVKACANDRFDITKSKVITAKFNGKAIKSASGKDDFCMDYANKATEFNQCPEDKK